jgi:hypothetical protein
VVPQSVPGGASKIGEIVSKPHMNFTIAPAAGCNCETSRCAGCHESCGKQCRGSRRAASRSHADSSRSSCHHSGLRRRRVGTRDACTAHGRRQTRYNFGSCGGVFAIGVTIDASTAVYCLFSQGFAQVMLEVTARVVIVGADDLEAQLLIEARRLKAVRVEHDLTTPTSNGLALSGSH